MSLCAADTVIKENVSTLNSFTVYLNSPKDLQFPPLFAKCFEPESSGAPEVKQEVEFDAEEL